MAVVTVTSHKGGIGKTTSAIHLASFLSRRDGEGSTVLVDADPNGSALGWASRGEKVGGLPFEVVSSREAGGVFGSYENVVVDTQGRPNGDGLAQLVRSCDLLVIPTSPEAMSVETIILMARDIEKVKQELGGRAEYKVLLTMVAWYNRRAATARRALGARGVPMLSGQVRDRAAFKTAEYRGLPVYELKSKGARDGWEDYENVGKEVAES